ncbi:hypothetical protein CCMSSC00406_0004032 [Pleurotus cornucopiae]|uniref:Uncharacterized protein n=1 Tax=Pleurotus cornucopiae TaxID=5321 RepID=A0ACB7ISH0_PLECO|nr:hypothetical protein CCMSSC00406_0004032 [Pleurotus cornucopiae]
MADYKGLLLAYTDHGELVNEAEFHDWYDDEHIPARAAVPGMGTISRYKQVDGQKPNWLALYDMSSPEVAMTEPFTKLPSSDNEKRIISNLATLNGAIYSLISASATSPKATPGPFICIAMMEPSVEGEDEFNKWYEEEHISLLSKAPGWIRSRRFKLVREIQLPGKEDAGPKLKYLALHELQNKAVMDTPEWIHAGTPWRNKVVNELVLRREMRLFEVYRTWELE